MSEDNELSRAEMVRLRREREGERRVLGGVCEGDRKDEEQKWGHSAFSYKSAATSHVRRS